jgi:hypothetical protein
MDVCRKLGSKLADKVGDIIDFCHVRVNFEGGQSLVLERVHGPTYFDFLNTFNSFESHILKNSSKYSYVHITYNSSCSADQY